MIFGLTQIIFSQIVWICLLLLLLLFYLVAANPDSFEDNQHIGIHTHTPSVAQYIWVYLGRKVTPVYESLVTSLFVKDR